MSQNDRQPYSDKLEQKRAEYLKRNGWSILRDVDLRALLIEAYREGYATDRMLVSK